MVLIPSIHRFYSHHPPAQVRTTEAVDELRVGAARAEPRAHDEGGRAGLQEGERPREQEVVATCVDLEFDMVELVRSAGQQAAAGIGMRRCVCLMYIPWRPMKPAVVRTTIN